MAAKFFTGLPLDGPDPECVLGHGEDALAARGDSGAPRPSPDHSIRPRKVAIALGTSRTAGGIEGQRAIVTPQRRPDRGCDEHPLVGFVPGAGPSAP
jgi:hypothetical protein